MKRLIVAVAAVLLAAGAIGPTQALAAGVTHWVNDDVAGGIPPGTGCSNPGYNAIQDAVDAATAGDVINVCPGTYSEEVVVSTPAKSNLLIRSTVFQAATIKAPAVMDPVQGDLVRIDNGARNVTFRNFVISGPLPDTLFCAVQLRSGVRVKGNSSANIIGNRITEMRSASPLLRGCQNGFAIAVGRKYDVPLPNQVGEATILSNTIDKYQKGGIYVDNSGSRATIQGNHVIGNGPDPDIAQNGMQISRGAYADIRNNEVSGNAYVGINYAVDSSSGILLYGTAVDGSPAPGTTVANNKVFQNDDNIPALGTQFVRILSNVVLDSTRFDGIYMGSDTANNRIEDNFLRNNTEHDCHDDSVGTNPPALVANFWIDNDGLTENKPGLCRGAHGDDDNDAEDDEDGENADHPHHHHGDQDDNHKRGDD
jgi:parallel beta-helix repeat protein